MEKIKWYEESLGKASAMRIMSMIALWMGSLLAWFALITKQLDINIIGLITMFLVAAFAPKALQKFAESNFIK